MLKSILTKTIGLIIDMMVVLVNVGLLEIVLRFDGFLIKEYPDPRYGLLSWLAFFGYALLMRKIMIHTMPGSKMLEKFWRVDS